MPRPDQHPILLQLGIGEPTCEVCVNELFPQASNDICNDCGLNPMRDDESAQEFMRASLRREFSDSPEEAVVRFMLQSLNIENPDVPGT